MDDIFGDLFAVEVGVTRAADGIIKPVEAAGRRVGTSGAVVVRAEVTIPKLRI